MAVMASAKICLALVAVLALSGLYLQQSYKPNLLAPQQPTVQISQYAKPVRQKDAWETSQDAKSVRQKDAWETRFPDEAFLHLAADTGFEDIDGEALRAQNRARLEALHTNADVKEKMCSANILFPPHQSRNLNWLHIPKAGTAFLSTVLRYGCVNGPAKDLPSYGDAKPNCRNPKVSKLYGSSCDYHGRDLIKQLQSKCTPVLVVRKSAEKSNPDYRS
jgi:hypothetical protein